MSDPKNIDDGAKLGNDKRPEDMRDDNAMKSGDEGKDAMTKTMADQAKQAGDGTDDEEDGLNPDGLT